MADPTPGNTTIGIEIECILICPKSLIEEYVDEHKLRYDSNAPLIMVHEALQQEYQTECWEPGCSEYHRRHIPLRPLACLARNRERPRSPIVLEDPRTHYSGWLVGHDGSVGLLPEEQKCIEECNLAVDQEFYESAIEIRSRILNFNKPTPCPGQERHPHDQAYDWHFELQYILTVLQTKFNNPDIPNMRLLVNNSTGIHVHVGGQRVEDWTRISQSVTGLYAAFEPHIDGILSTPRIGAWHCNRLLRQHSPHAYQFPKIPLRTYDYPNSESETLSEPGGSYCLPASCTNFSRIDAIDHASVPSQSMDRRIYPENQDPHDHLIIEAEKKLHVPAWLCMIMGATSVGDVDDLYHTNGGHCCAVNLENMISDGHELVKPKNTIEFRAHPGSLDTRELVPWVEVCGKMVERSANSTSADTVDYLLANWANPSFTFVDLLLDMEVSANTHDFYQDMLNTDEYAQDRYDATMEREKLYPQADVLSPLVELVETRRRKERTRRYVDEKIRRKFESGLYGKYPRSYVDAKLPTRVAADYGHLLAMTADDNNNIALGSQDCETDI